jgi:predicted AAA+ superfamily ATPase
MIIREKYIKKIRPFIAKPVIKVITGIRRCGKSVLMQQIRDELILSGVSLEQITYINKELHEFDYIRNYHDLHTFLTTNVKSGKNALHYIFIDEVQEIEQWERAVGSFLAENKYDIYITGSNAQLLSSELAGLLSGRYVEFQIHTLTYLEFTELRKMQKSLSDNNSKNYFEEFLKFGGFPGLHSLLWDENVIRQYLQSVFNTIVLKDIIMRNNIRDAAMLQRILSYVTDNIGNITTSKNISDYIKSQQLRVAPETVQNYLLFATSAYMLYQAKRYDIKGKKLLELHEKYYLGDLGLLYALFGYQPDKISVRLENIVLHEMLTRGYNVKIGKFEQREIDFICERGNEKIYLQVCLSLYQGNAAEREYKAYEGVEDHFPKYVLSMDKGFDTNKNGVIWMNIEEFLLSK